MADNNEDCLSVNSDFVRIPANTPMDGDTDVEELDLDEGRETPNGFAASEFGNSTGNGGNQAKKPSSIDPVVAALMEKVDMLSKENSELLAKFDEIMTRQHAMVELQSLREHLPSAQLLSELVHDKEHENAKFVLVDNSKDAMWDTSDSKLTVANFTVKLENELLGSSIRSTHGFPTAPVNSNSDSLIYNIHYYEITICESATDSTPLFVGLADKNHRLDRSISASEHTFGVGFAFGFRNKNMHNGKEETVFNEALTCTGGDVIGCGLMVAQKTKSAANCEQCQQKQCTIFLTKNGQLWGTPIPLGSDVPSMLYPAISLYRPGSNVTANFGQQSFKYVIPPARGLNVCGHCCHCKGFVDGLDSNEGQKIPIGFVAPKSSIDPVIAAQESNCNESKGKANNDLAALPVQMAEMQADFQSKLDAMQSKHNAELEVLHEEISVLALTSFHGPLEILKHLKPEFVELTLVNNTENAAWNFVDNSFSVSGNSVTRSGSNSCRSIRSKRGFLTGKIFRYSMDNTPHKAHLVFNYFEITIDRKTALQRFLPVIQQIIHIGIALHWCVWDAFKIAVHREAIIVVVGHPAFVDIN